MPTKEQMEALLRERSFVTAADAACVAGISIEEAAQQLQTVAASLSAGGVTAVYSVSSSCNDSCGEQRVMLCWGDEAVKKALSLPGVSSPSVFAVVTENAASRTIPLQPAKLKPALQPKAVTLARPYPLVTRAALEVEAESGVPAKPMSQSLSGITTKSEQKAPPPPVPTQGKVSPSAVPPTKPVKAEPSLTEPVAAGVKVEPVATAPCVEKAETTQKKKEEPVAAPTVDASDAKPVAQEPAPKKQPSLFDMMQTAAATAAKAPPAAAKRAREEDGTTGKKVTAKAPAKPKAPKKEAPVDGTNLAKLAKATARKRKADSAKATPAVVPTSMHGLLDEEEDDDDGRDGHSCSAGADGSLGVHTVMSEPYMSGEASVLDVTVSAPNDDIIICDDAPPLAFCAPPASEASDARTAATGAMSAGAAPSSASAFSTAARGAGQATLGAFFNAEILAFQKAYRRTMRTEMKKAPDGEYVCVDVPVYEPVSGEGKSLTEEEYHQRSAEIADAQRTAAAEGASSDQAAAAATAAGSGGDSPDCAATTGRQKPSKNASRPAVAKSQPVKPQAAAKKTLLSFFKPSV